jgi:choline dehydrogenase-like flavoprotein
MIEPMGEHSISIGRRRLTFFGFSTHGFRRNSSYGEVFGSNLNWAWKADQGKSITGFVYFSLDGHSSSCFDRFSGKTLGGSSAINGAAWTRGLNSSYDAWSSLLEPAEASVGWNWQNLWGYMKKVRIFSPLTILSPLTRLY